MINLFVSLYKETCPKNFQGKILHVDADDVLGRQLREVFQKFLNYDIDSVDTLNKGLDKLNEGCYDLVIVDPFDLVYSARLEVLRERAGLPFEDYEDWDNFRRYLKDNGIPLIVLSAFTKDELMRHYSLEDSVDCLLKPEKTIKLLKCVKGYLKIRE